MSNASQRPFLNYYASTFILYELSTPFLNVHWFCDKLNLTGSKIQLYNGITLLATFFGCRLVWGTWQSGRVYVDMYHAVYSSPDAGYLAAAHGNATTFRDPNYNIMAFAVDAKPIPVWLAGTYVASNIVLNGLNWHWFFKMITAVKKRFEPPKETDGDAKGTSGESTGAAKGKGAPGLRRRGHSIQEFVPDTDDLRDCLLYTSPSPRDS